jgi:hypothetical protein
MPLLSRLIDILFPIDYNPIRFLIKWEIAKKYFLLNQNKMNIECHEKENSR